MFRLPGEERAATIVERAFGGHFDLGSKMLESLTAVLSSTNSAELKVPTSVAVAALSLMSKTIKLVRAVYLLCAVGLSEEAAPLVRAMIEVYAHAEFLSNGDKEKNSRRMLAIEAITRARHQERPVPEHGAHGAAVERAAQSAKEFREEASHWIMDKEELKELESLARQYRQWTGRRITEMIDALADFGGIVGWRGAYAALSSSAHAGDVSRHVKEGTEKYVADLQPAFFWGGAMVSHANDFAWAIATSVSKLAPIYSNVSLQPIEAMKNMWDELPMYALERDGKVILYNFLVHPMTVLEIP